MRVRKKKIKCSLQLMLEDKHLWHLCYSRVLIIKYGWQFRFPETFLNNRFTSEPVLCAFRLWNWNIEKNLLTRMLPENCCRILAADLKNSCKLLPWILSNCVTRTGKKRKFCIILTLLEVWWMLPVNDAGVSELRSCLDRHWSLNF